MNPITVLELLVIGIGGALVVHGASRWVRGGRGRGDSRRVLSMIQGFRLAIVGLALAGVAIGLMTDRTWVVILSLAIAGEEVLETSIMIAALRAERRRRII